MWWASAAPLLDAARVCYPAGHALRGGNALWRRSLFGYRSSFLLWVACGEEVLSTTRVASRYECQR